MEKTKSGLDEVIKRRLVIDGEGTGDDRRFLLLMKSFAEFTLGRSESSLERGTSFRRLGNLLHQTEASFSRTDIAIKSNTLAITSFRNLSNEIKLEIEDVKVHIKESKKLLEEASRVRKMDLESHAFAKLINSKPDRAQMEIQRDKLLGELKELTNQKEALDRKLREHRNVLAILSSLAETLKDQLNDNEEIDDPNVRNVIHGIHGNFFI